MESVWPDESDLGELWGEGEEGGVVLEEDNGFGCGAAEENSNVLVVVRCREKLRSVPKSWNGRTLLRTSLRNAAFLRPRDELEDFLHARVDVGLTKKSASESSMNCCASYSGRTWHFEN